jgi:hypothetical protein
MSLCTAPFRQPISTPGAKSIANITIEELLSENQELHNLVVSLSTRLLRNSVRKAAKGGRGTDCAERLLEDAEECFYCARIQSLPREIATGLEAAGNALMAKAVEIETKLQREKWKK